jgi:hypothetical protein
MAMENFIKEGEFMSMYTFASMDGTVKKRWRKNNIKKVFLIFPEHKKRVYNNSEG